ncbi:MAG TPA: RNA polymerase sigma factor [Rhizomicrobium sp.]|nr:RNA polymerase sigma factor [Rhizomicrobium sp.]
MNDEKPSWNNESVNARAEDTAVPWAEVKAWFVRDVLPLEATLMRFLQRNCRNPSDVEDVRQEVYANLLRAAEKAFPERTKPFLFSTARNVLIDRLRRDNVIPIEVAADLDLSVVPSDEPGPERSVFARETLRRLQLALNDLPPRYREALILKRIEGLSLQEISHRMGIPEQVVSNYVRRGVFVLADQLYGEQSAVGGEHDLT